MDEKAKRNLGYWIVAILLIATVQHWLSDTGTVEPVPYSEFERYLQEGKIADVLISDLAVTGRLKKPDPNGKEVIVATRVEPDLAAQLSKYKVRFTRVIETANLVNEAALMATRRQADAVTLEDFTAAIERIVAGLEKKNRILSDKEREVVAFHEMGHALVALALPGTDTVHKVSIIPRGIGALGYTIQRPTEDRYLMTREELENKIAVFLGGRAAEKLVFGNLSTGAADDLAKATDIARDMVTRFGMDEGLGYVVFEPSPPRFLQVPGAMTQGGCRLSEDTARKIDDAIRNLVMSVFGRASDLLAANRQVLDRCAQVLLAKETLDEAVIAELTRRPPPIARRAGAGGAAGAKL